MRKVLPTLLLLLAVFTLQAQNRNPFGLDDVNTARYIKAQQLLGDSAAFMLIADSFEVEGLAEPMPLKRLICADLKAFYCFTHRSDEVFKHLDQAALISREIGNMNAYFSYRSNSINFYLNMHKLAEAMQIAQQTVEESKEYKDPRCLIDALNCLANTYDASGNEALALSQYKDILTICEKEGDKLPRDRKLIALMSLASSYYERLDVTTAEKYLQKALAIDANMSKAYYLRAHYALTQGDKNTFHKIYQTAQGLGPDILGENPYYMALFEMMNAAANNNLEEAIMINRQINDDDYSFHRETINIYKWAGLWNQAYRELEKLTHMRDSLDTDNNQKLIASMTAEMHTIYETMEKEAQIQRQRYTMIIGSLAFLALLIIAAVIAYRNIEIRKKNRALVNNLNELLDMRRKEKALDMQESEKEGTSTERHTTIVQRYIHELTSRNLFCNPDFDRMALLDELHLQKSNFWKLFEEETGTTAPKYILNLRLEYAAEQIRLHPNIPSRRLLPMQVFQAVLHFTAISLHVSASVL